MKNYNNVTTIYPNYLEPYVGFSNSYRCLGRLEDALDIQKRQIKLMEDNNTTSLPINQKGINCRDNSGDIILLNSSMEKYYFYYNIALTYYLLNDEKMAQENYNKANGLNLDLYSKLKVLDVVNLDIKNLQKTIEKKPKLQNKIIEFQNKFVLPQVQVS